MGIRDKVRAWILEDEERDVLAWAVRKREPLHAAVLAEEWELRRHEIKKQRELVEAFERTDLDHWDQAEPRVRVYFGPKPNEHFFQYEVDCEKRKLESLEAAFERWQGLSP